MSDDPFLLAIMAGGVHASAGHPPTDNPHRDGSALALCWRHGFEGGRIKDTVSRETKSVPRPGRGRPVMGDRGEWTKDTLRQLKVCTEAGMSRVLAAKVLGRSAQAVRTQASRQKKRRAA